MSERRLPAEYIPDLHAKRYFDSFDAVKDEQPQATIKIYECGGVIDRGARAIVVEDADPTSAFIIHVRFQIREAGRDSQ